MVRKAISEKIVDEVLSRSRRRCALCYGLERCKEVTNGQIAHIDRDSSNATFDNLVFLCLDHHDKYDSKTSQSKNFTPNELKQYRDELYSDLEKSLSVASNFFTSATYSDDTYSGKYAYEAENREASLTIRHISGERYLIDGMAFYGTQSKGGPNIGELCEIGILTSGVLTFSDFSDDGEEEKYSIRITFYGQKIEVLDSCCCRRFGAGVSFSGTYTKC